MGKREADKQLTQLNQFEEDNAGGSEGSSGFARASEDVIAKRVIKMPKSRKAKVANDGTTAKASSAFAGFAGFGTPATSAASEGTAGTLSGFSFGSASKTSTFTAATASASASPAVPKPTAFTFGTSTTPSNPFASSSFKAAMGNSEAKGANSPTSSAPDTTFGATSNSFGFAATDSKASATTSTAPTVPALSFTSPTSTTSTTPSAWGSTPPVQKVQPFKPPTATATSSSSSTTTAAWGMAPPSQTVQPFRPPVSTATDAAGAKAPVSAVSTTTAATSSSSSRGREDAASDNTARLRQYMLNLQGLNQSFAKAVQGYLQSNPHLDISFCFQSYHDHLSNIRDRFRDVLDTTAGESRSTSQAPEAPKPAAFGGSTAFGGQPPAKETGSSSTSAFGNSVFGSDKASAGDDKSPAFESPFSTLNGTGSSGTTKPSTATTKDGGPAASSTSSTGFGGVGESHTSPFGSWGAAKPPILETEGKPAASMGFGGFGSTSKPAFGSGSWGAPSATAAPSSEAAKPTAPSVFGSTTFGSGNSFGGSTSGSGAFSSGGSGFSSSGFGAPVTSAAATGSSGFTGFGGGAQPAKPEAVDATEESSYEPPSTLTQSTSRAGEEDEVTIYETLCKVFAFDATKKSFGDRGVGDLRINRHRETGAMRLLCRQKGSDTISLNVAVFPAMQFTHPEGKKDIVFIAVAGEGKPTKFLLRVKTPELARELKSQLEEARDSLEK
ncbi:hypothetical protein IWQ60_011938 [Tieghemiomyces parasiticus]|uniref:RanBD1 domain-containing protein n=1 Tax=Tieghemiomyces parasiticus TaxID=78921 RepID=A0A9W8DL73_9FUNG|nr:hypothetical protein IWQ60_011938 [Tieghemiomyces parasiticus]